MLFELFLKQVSFSLNVLLGQKYLNNKCAGLQSFRTFWGSLFLTFLSLSLSLSISFSHCVDTFTQLPACFSLPLHTATKV